MKVVLTDEALRDLDDILTFSANNYPEISVALEQRIRRVLMRIGTWPGSAQEVPERPGVRVAPLVQYPYKVFYRINPDAVEILHIHHTARRVPWDE